jgi:hypothetical protein
MKTGKPIPRRQGAYRRKRFQQGLYESSKTYMETASPIWRQKILYEASKTYMEPAWPIWRQQNLY